MSYRRMSIVVILLVLATVGSARAERKEPLPKDLQNVGVQEHLDAALPLDAPFVDSQGRPVQLGDYFDDQVPVILTMNYSSCPMLCSLQLNGLFTGLQSVDWNLGQKYRVVTVSIDPKEPPQRARQTEQKYLKVYDRPGVEEGFVVLTGREENIRRVAETVGFGYAWVPETEEYAHAAVVMVCTPQGHVSRYLYGVDYEPQTMRMALLEAADGKIGTTLDRFILFCYHYDAAKGRYGPHAFRVMQVGGLATVLVLGTVLAAFWRRESRRGRRGGPAQPAEEPPQA